MKIKDIVLKDWSIPLPMLVEGGEVMTISSAKTLDEAAEVANIMAHSS